jgi:hypothetical protein
MTKNKEENLTEKVKLILSDLLGAEPDDIEITDDLYDDLMMRASDVADFAHALENKGIDIKNIDMSEVHSIEELIEFLTSENIV